MTLHPIFQDIIDAHFPALNSEKRCTICGEFEDECVCVTCPWCGISDMPEDTLEGRECPACGELMNQTPEEPDSYEENAYFVKTDTEAIMHSPWFE